MTATPAEIRILIADDHQMFIEGIKALLRKEPHMHFVGEANDGLEALNLLEKTVVDVLITDISMPGMDGIALTQTVKQRWPEIKVLVVSMHNDPAVIGEILLAEAEGYILKNTGKAELIEAIHQLMNDGTHYSPVVLATLMRKAKHQVQADDALRELTERELEVLKLIVQEFSTADIAEKLFISPRTVDSHRKNIMSKTQSRTLVGLIKFAFRNAIIT
jgi:DNA-binding NarL/FixJ family response regulator